MVKWGYQAPFDQFIINARVEDLQFKKTFKDLANASRCVVIIEGYFEWTPNHEPYVFRPKPNKDSDLPSCLYIASLVAPDGTVILLTRQALWEFVHVHERMPMILSADEIDKWLDCENYKYEKIIGDITSPENEKWSTMYHYQIGPLINNIKNKGEKNLLTLEEYKKDLDKTGIKSFFQPKKKKEEEKKPEEPVVAPKQPAKEQSVVENQTTQSTTHPESEATQKIDIDAETAIAETLIEDQEELNVSKISQDLADKLAMEPEKPVPHLDNVKHTMTDMGLHGDGGGFKATNAFLLLGKGGKPKQDDGSKSKRGKKRKEPGDGERLVQENRKQTKITQD